MRIWYALLCVLLFNNNQGNCASRCTGSVSLSPSGPDVLSCRRNGACDQCTVNCDNSHTCTIDCTAQDSCKGSTVNCPSRGDCIINCSGPTSCVGLKVNCPEQGACAVTCSSSQSCKNIDVNQKGGSGGALTVSCDSGSDVCQSSNIDCPKAAPCTLKCGVNTACKDTTLKQTGTGQAKLICTAASSCEAVKYKCSTNRNARCALECSSNNACKSTTLNCPRSLGPTGSCGVACNGPNTCTELSPKMPTGDINWATCSTSNACTSRLRSLDSSSTRPPVMTPAPRTQVPKTSAPATPAPSTPVPPTPAPSTPVPPTPAPSTPVPPTPTPRTSIPATSSPSTPSPNTAVPTTSSPATRSPPTSLPATASPQTPIPMTPAPVTVVPATSVPVTLVPATSTPLTPVPVTIAPATPAPATTIPATLMPSTSVPATAIPSTLAPATSAPRTSTPVTSVPDTAVPSTLSPVTPLPDTSAPATKVPSTSAPITAPPHTANPDTTAPRTFAPNTFAPTTLAPLTLVPSTQPPTQPTFAPPVATPAPLSVFIPPTSVPFVPTLIPPTPLPSTAAPGVTFTPMTAAPPQTTKAQRTEGPTAVPATLAPYAQVLPPDQKKQTEAATSAASGVALAAGAGGGTASRLVVLQGFGCEVEDVDLEHNKNLDWEFHPTRAAFGAGTRRYMLAAAIMNPVVCVGFLVVLYMVAFAIFKMSDMSWARSMATARAPGLSYVPYLFLLQGTSLVSARMAFFPEDNNSTATTVVGWTLLLFTLATPALLYLLVLRHVPRLSRAIPDPRLFPEDEAVQMLSDEASEKVVPYTGWKKTAYRFCFGDTIWVGSGEVEEGYFTEQYGVVFEPFREGMTWFVLTELACILLLSLLSAWRPGIGMQCHGRNGLITLLFLAYLVLLCWLRPFSAAMDNLISIALTAFMVFAVLFMTIGIIAEVSKDHMLFVAAGWMLLVSAILLLLKALWDIGTYAIDIYLSRRYAVREMVRNAGQNNSMGALKTEEPAVEELTDMNIDIYVVLPDDCDTLTSEGSVPKQSLFNSSLNGTRNREVPALFSSRKSAVSAMKINSAKSIQSSEGATSRTPRSPRIKDKGRGKGRSERKENLTLSWV